ncbi:uncharacterized protein C8Q71DRAFT_762414 [Rhodofomes roseus]|uniref:Secreted protein n=1 Tax=Rhodofomes roseus TaxID=34475 RepID=A0ABQ8KF76_9APHY|nr:uncharacterized protein C8Q71DRAFT_762414 [Rhodofomes roseus]KAH9836398.1 hypothetical protein C8Q71DRAFT_762414 [Rhodofomes roseus]
MKYCRSSIAPCSYLLTYVVVAVLPCTGRTTRNRRTRRVIAIAMPKGFSTGNDAHSIVRRLLSPEDLQLTQCSHTSTRLVIQRFSTICACAFLQAARETA